MSDETATLLESLLASARDNGRHIGSLPLTATNLAENGYQVTAGRHFQKWFSVQLPEHVYVIMINGAAVFDAWSSAFARAAGSAAFE